MRWIAVAALSLFLLTLPAEAARQAHSATMTVRLIARETDSKVLTDRPPQQELNRGDVLWVESVLRNAVPQFGRPKGAVVGRDTTILTVLSATHGRVLVQTLLPRGTLEAAGRVRFGARQTYPVTGGTGRFAKARGIGESRALDPPSNRRLRIYRLRLP